MPYAQPYLIFRSKGYSSCQLGEVQLSQLRNYAITITFFHKIKNAGGNVSGG
jgi:hypothetical protein